MKQEILLEEIKKFLDNSAAKLIPDDENFNTGPFPDILPVILHKLKNKLTPILGYAQILQMKNTDESLKERIDRIERNACDLTELFDNLKNSLIIRKPVMEFRDINELILHEKELFKKIRDNGINVLLALDNTIPRSTFNPGHISLLLQSSIQNAITGIILRGIDNGEIQITSGWSDDEIFLRIGDNGIGIESDDINNIWTPFFSKFPDHGGIGLLTVEKVISDHKGKYSVFSEPGSYTEFTFRFPVKKAGAVKKRLNFIKVVMTGFSVEETAILSRITGDQKDISFCTMDANDLASDKYPDTDHDVIFVNSDLVNLKKNREILSGLADQFNGSEIIFFYSGDIPVHLLDIIVKRNIRLVSDGTKLLSVINILAKAINKEE